MTIQQPEIPENDPRANARETLRALSTGPFLDGLVKRIAAQFSELDKPAAEDVVSEAMGALYDALAGRKRVDSPEAWVYKTARNIAQVVHQQRLELVDPGDLDAIPAPESASTPQPSRDTLRAEALRVARRLLPRLGQTTAQRVMDVIFDAVEAGEPDISSVAIAEMLGLSNDVVRQARKRGFERLERVAAKEGLTMTFEEALSLEDDDEHETED